MQQNGIFSKTYLFQKPIDWYSSTHSETLSKDSLAWPGLVDPVSHLTVSPLTGLISSFAWFCMAQLVKAMRVKK
jgi:hypothetical protein